MSAGDVRSHGRDGCGDSNFDPASPFGVVTEESVGAKGVESVKSAEVAASDLAPFGFARYAGRREGHDASAAGESPSMIPRERRSFAVGILHAPFFPLRGSVGISPAAQCCRTV